MFHIYRDRYSRGFKAGVGRFVVGIRWQRELRRLYLRLGDVTHVLYGRERSYDPGSPEGMRRLMDGITIEEIR